MNINEAVERACQEPTLVKALSWIAIWDTERVVKKVRAEPDKPWETLFELCFNKVMERYGLCPTPGEEDDDDDDEEEKEYAQTPPLTTQLLAHRMHSNPALYELLLGSVMNNKNSVAGRDWQRQLKRYYQLKQQPFNFN